MEIARSFKEAVIQMMKEIAKAIPDTHKEYPVKAYLTGGGAVHYYCNARVSDDIDLIMPYAVKIPEDLIVSKIIRFAENDERDIRHIIKLGNVDKNLLYALADDAIRVGVGFREQDVRNNLAFVMEMFE